MIVDRTTVPERDNTIRELVLSERRRLEAELGLHERPIVHATRPAERPFTRAQRPFTTVLFGGLTWKHERLIQAMMQGLGYLSENLRTPTVRSYQIGREFGNNGQCNPTYFTVGNLVEHLQQLEAQGLSRQEIIDRYVFFTAGACGPCRFGMYEAEFRLALRNAGFDGFRVLILEQTGGLNQAVENAGLELNLDFTLGLLNAFIIADVLNDIAYQIRPFEITAGETDRALADSIEHMAEFLRTRIRSASKRTGMLKRALPVASGRAETLRKFLVQLLGGDLVRALRECRERFSSIEVDRTRVKPVVKVTGEFWAQTTEGDGNFNMFRFLEHEGAQVVVEPIATWLLYMLHQAKQDVRDRRFKEIAPDVSIARRATGRLASRLRAARKLAVLSLAEALFSREYQRARKALGNLPYALPNQYELQRIAHSYYNSRLEGGEGHLEIAKNIYYSSKRLCHMVLSVKPFGCMPSTQSDGVQSAVISHFRDVIYLPIETSGEGEINAHSRVQMVLGEARSKARDEYGNTLEKYGISDDRLKSIIGRRPELRRPMHRIPKRRELVGAAANFAAYAAAFSDAAERNLAV